MKKLIEEGVLNITLNESEQKWSNDDIPVEKIDRENTFEEQDSAIDMKVSAHQKLKK